MNDFIKELLSEFRTSALFKRELDNLMQPFYDDPALIDAICVFEKPGDWVTDRNDQLQAIFESESRNTLIMVSKDDLKNWIENSHTRCNLLTNFIFKMMSTKSQTQHSKKRCKHRMRSAKHCLIRKRGA